MFKQGTRVLVGMLVIGLVCLCAAGGWVASTLGGSSSQLAVKELEARISDNERAEAEAEAWPQAIRENWDGLAEYTLTRGTVERDAEITEALIELALADLHNKQQWDAFAQMMIGVVVLVFAFVVPLRY